MTMIKFNNNIFWHNVHLKKNSFKNIKIINFIEIDKNK